MNFKGFCLNIIVGVRPHCRLENRLDCINEGREMKSVSLVVPGPHSDPDRDLRGRLNGLEYLGARVDASVDVKLQLVPVLQLEAQAGALLLQAAPVQDDIAVFVFLSLFFYFDFLSLSPVFVYLCRMAIWSHKISASSM